MPVAPNHPAKQLTAEQEASLAKCGVWMRPDQVAEVLANCSRETVRALRNAGMIECRDFRTPGAKQPCWRFYTGSVRQYLATRPDPAALLGV